MQQRLIAIPEWIFRRAYKDHPDRKRAERLADHNIALLTKEHVAIDQSDQCDLDVKDTCMAVRKAVSRLEEPVANVVHRKLDGQTYKSMAMQLGLDTKQCQTIFEKGKRHLAQIVNPELYFDR